MTGRYVVGETRGDAESGGIPEYRVVCERSGLRGFGCTWPKGHPGDHVATDQSGEIYEVWPQAGEGTYRVGDDDPTPDMNDNWCGFRFTGPGEANVECTWPAGHEGDHVAGDGDHVVAVHPQNDDLADPEEVEAAIASILAEY